MGRAVFYNKDAFDQPIGPWDMSKVTNTDESARISFPGLHASSSPTNPLFHHAERAPAPLCGDAIDGRSACGFAWSIVRSRGCLSCVGPCVWWTMGGLRPVVWLCDGAAQCS